MRTVKEILKNFIEFNRGHINFAEFEYELLDNDNPNFISGFTLEDYIDVDSLYSWQEVEKYEVDFDQQMITLFLK